MVARMPDIAEDLHACTMCGYCVPVCPAFQEIGWESSSPRGKVFYMRRYDMRSLFDRLIRKKVEIDAEFSKSTYECTGCGACERACMVDIRFDGLWDDVKEWMVESGLGPMPEHIALYENVRKERNIYGEAHEKRDAWIPADANQSASPEIVFWAGCVQSYRQRQVAQAVVKILNAAGVKYRLLGKEEWCTGAPLARVGYGQFVKKELMPHNVDAVAGTGAKILVTACAECYRAFEKDYRRYGGGMPFAVQHISQFVERLVKEKRLKLTKPLQRKITFHDPCNLSRVCKVDEPPRTVLKGISGLQIVEMYHNRGDCLCSGAGGGFALAFPQEAGRLAQRRLQEAKEVGAETVATSCPFALEHMQDVSQRTGKPIDILDFVELVASAL